MAKIAKAAERHNGTTHETRHWRRCVSVATSLLSTSWREFFFDTVEDAKAFCAFCEDAGYAVLMVTPDEY